MFCSSNLNPYVALRDKFWRVTIGLLLFSKLYPYTCTYVALHDKYITPHLTYFPFLHDRTLTVRPCCQSSVMTGLDDFSQKICKIHFFAPVLTNKIPGRKLIASAKYQTGTIGNDGVPHKALGIMPALFGPPHACCIRKNIRTLYCTTLLYHRISTLNYYCTEVY